MPLWLKRDYRAVSGTLASCVLGLVLMRIIVYFANMPADNYGQELIESAVFTVGTQIVFFFAIPFALYKFYGKRTVKQTLEFGSIGKFKLYYLLAIPLGFCVFMVTIGVSSAWTSLLRLTGYTVSSYTPEMPESFVWQFFLADAVLTALLPAICEEFAMRGGLLTTAKKSFGVFACVIICGITFGLFHQNIRQVFYTSLFGALAAFLTLKTGSLYPAMIMHFCNNFLSVYIDYSTEYGWAVGGNFYDVLNSVPSVVLVFVFILIFAIGAALVIFMLYFNDKNKFKAKLAEFKSANGYPDRNTYAPPPDFRFEFKNADGTEADDQNVAMPPPAFDGQTPQSAEVPVPDPAPKAVRSDDVKYKPSLRDVAFIIALAVVALCTTVFTYVWGFLY